jgi:hypothetical protein
MAQRKDVYRNFISPVIVSVEEGDSKVWIEQEGEYVAVHWQQIPLLQKMLEEAAEAAKSYEEYNRV